MSLSSLSPFPLRRVRAIGFACASLLTAALTPTRAATLPAYHLAATWKLAGEGGWDLLTCDSPSHRLYITRGTRLQVLDTRSGALLGEITGLEGAHGVALDAKLGRGFVTSGRTNSVVAFDLKTLQRVGIPIAVGENPDAIALEPTTNRLFAFNAHGNSVSVFDPQNPAAMQTLALGGNPEFGVADGKGSVFVNLEHTSEVLQIDAKTLQIVHRWPLAPGEEPTGLAYDAKKSRLFAGCANKTLVVLDAKTGKIIAAVPIGEGVDATAFDPKLNLAFSSNGRDATLSIVGDGAIPTLQSSLATHSGARTLALDPKTHALFVVAADYEAAAPAGQTPRRPKMIPGSAVVLKYELNR